MARSSAAGTSVARDSADLEKYSEAAALGWLVIRVLPEQLRDQRTLGWIRRALARVA